MKTQASRPRLLLVCDEDLTGELLQDMLERAGYYVRLAISLAEGRLQFRASAYDVVIVNVAGADPSEAIEFCEEIKKIAPAQTLAFLAGSWTYVPPRSCADSVLPRDHGPDELLSRLAEITPPNPAAAPPSNFDPGLA